MLVSDDRTLVDYARKLSSQAREPVAHYEHTEIGYNYRMSNVLAAIGCGQLTVIEDRVRRRREIYDFYRVKLGDIPGLTFVDEMPYGCHNRWLTTVLVDPAEFGVDREQIRLKLEEHNIESRPLWKPMHLQPVFQGCEVIGGQVAESLFEQGLCLPSGTAMTSDQLDRVISIIQEMAPK
jgi:pyridoxal phosphate-dependent aminotransferase EpsN